MNIGTQRGPFDAVQMALLDHNLSNRRYFVGAVTPNIGGMGHAITLQSVITENGVAVGYTYHDPWTNEEHTFSAGELQHGLILFPYDEPGIFHTMDYYVYSLLAP
jgi:hypothetical protein